MQRVLKKAIAVAIPATLLSLLSLQLMCRGVADPPKDAPRSNVPPVIAKSATTLPAGRTNVRVGIMMVVHREYGILAHLAGERNSTVTDEPYDKGKNWWDNPMIIFEDASFANSPVTAGADSESISGRGKSANVSLEMTLIPHADFTSLKGPVASDCIKGTLTATITTFSDFYDGGWTEVANVKDAKVAFNFDTSDKTSRLRPTTSETRTMPPFSFERYTRAHEKWEPKSAWPTNAKSGDWRCTIYVKDANLRIIGYQYVDRAPGETPTTNN